MNAQATSKSVLFADITESTRLYKALGDEGGRRLLLQCLELLNHEVERCGGTVVDRIGDELMCTFPDPVSAGRASCELHRAVEAANEGFPRALRIRVGFHHGPLLVDERQIFGETIHVARRVASLAKPQQSLTTRETKDLIPAEERHVTRFVDRTHLKGQTGPVELFEVVWDVGASTVTAEAASRIAAEPHPSVELVLDSGAQIYAVDSMRPTLTIGRDPRADVVIEHARVSRVHARIEYRKNTFAFVDQSTNGSQVIERGGTRRFVRRDEHLLIGEGTIVLGPEGSGTEFPSLAYRLRMRECT